MRNLNLALVKLSEDVQEPLNLLYIASYLNKEVPSVKIKIIDRAYDKVVEEIERFNPDLVGISAMTVEYPLAIKLCKIIKEKRKIPVILGGSHISFLPQSLNSCFDLGMIGESEITLSKFMKIFNVDREIKTDRLHDIDGIVFYDKYKLIIKPQKEFIQNLDDIPIPNRDSLNKKYFTIRPTYSIGKYRRRNSILTSRGCPYNCKFCISTRFFRKLRFHSSKRVVEEVRYLYNKYKIRHFNIWDDLFCCNIKRIEEIIELLEKEKLLGRISFNASMRGNLATDNVFELYKKMGIKSIGIGIESGSDRVLRYLKGENITVKQNLDAVIGGKKRGFKMMGSIMIGNPTEKIEDLKKTYELIKKLIDAKIDRLLVFVLVPYPGSEFWSIAEERGKVSNDMDFSKLSFHDKTPLLLDEDVPLEEFYKIQKDIDKELNRIKYKCNIEYLMDNPFRTITSILSRPSALLRLFGLKDNMEEVSKI